MLYIAFLALLFLSQISAECNEYDDQQTCDSDNDCQWSVSQVCLTEGGPNCCEEAAVTTPEPCPINGDCSVRGDDDCCEASSACYWVDSPLCASPDASGPACCFQITPEPTTAQPTTANPTSSEPTTAVPTPAPTCPDYSDNANPCNGYEQDCCPTNNGLCQWSNTQVCAAEGGPFCCEEVTTTAQPTTANPTSSEPTTAVPTPAPTCPDYSGNANPCNGYEQDCCPTDNGVCQWSNTQLCAAEGGPECCEEVTTTANPTTPSPETPLPTTSAPVTAQPTTTTVQTPEPTPYGGPPFTTSTSTSTKIESTSLSTSTTNTESTTPEPSKNWPTKKPKRPTPRPTMKSAMKWEMIHPAYSGGDGELLWHVYYGDFSNDDRFDGFRRHEMWDVNEIRPILEADQEFIRYRREESEKIVRSQKTTVKKGSANAYGVWLMIISGALVVIFGVWYQCCYKKPSKTEYMPLLSGATTMGEYIEYK